MWKRADYQQGKLVTRFALCGADWNEDGLLRALLFENETYGDLMLMDCREGYGQGLLTRKTLAAMKEYLRLFPKKQLFMKIDDDTFAAWSRIWPLVSRAWENYTYHVYMGTLKPPSTPTRDPFNAFYEPRDTFPDDKYPQSADGGPGYILGGPLVRRIVEEQIAEHWVLYNEDKAVAVWVDNLRQRGEDIHFIAVEGQTGYAVSEEEWRGQLKWFHSGRWIAYPLLLHHRLSGEAIECLSLVEHKKDNNATIDQCFTESDNTWIPMKFRKEADWTGHEVWLSKHTHNGII